MTTLYPSTDNSTNGSEPLSVCMNQLMFSKLAEASLVIPNCIQVMLTLVLNAKSDGSIELTSSEVTRLCGLTLKKVTAAVFGLAGAGLLVSLNVRASFQGVVICQVAPDLIRSTNAEQS